MLGYPEGFATGLDALELVHPDDQAMVAEILGRAFTEPGTHGPVVVRVRARDGTWRYLEAIGNNLLDNPAVHGVVVVRARRHRARRRPKRRCAAATSGSGRWCRTSRT